MEGSSTEAGTRQRECLWRDASQLAIQLSMVEVTVFGNVGSGVATVELVVHLGSDSVWYRSF